jgi:hypothetical protein
VDLDACIDQDPLVNRVEARDFPVLVLEQRRPMEARLAGCPAVRPGDLELLAEMRGVGKELLRDAADVDAGAAEAAFLGDRYLGAVAGGNAAGTDAARAAADGEKVVIEAQLADSGLLRVYFRL